MRRPPDATVARARRAPHISLVADAASRVEQAIAELKQQGVESPRVAILGAGIIGLSTAKEIAGRCLPLKVYARDFDAKTTSWVSGGQFRPAG